MRYTVGGQLRLLAAAVGLSIALSTTGCAGFILRQDAESARADWTLSPSGQRAAIYAEALHDAFAGHAYADDPAGFKQRAGEALVALAAAESGSGVHLPTLIACRGLLLLDLGRNQEGWAELQRSMAIAPTLLAARGIVPSWGAARRGDKVAEACELTLPVMREPEGRFALLDLCAKNMHTATEAAALAWAPPEARAFYRDERARREEAASWQSDTSFADQQALQAAELANQLASQQAQQATDMANQAAMAATQQAATPP